MARHTLQPGYELHWYVIQEVLGQGGFGITYLATDSNLNQQVAIKEYLPTELAIREQNDSVQPMSGEHGGQFKWGLERFINEARTLAKFKHPNIVRVLTVFSDNNTAYMVMEYENGEALSNTLKQQKTLTQTQQLAILEPLLDGLEQVHKMGFIHRDIKPANIYLRDDNSPVLLDFGSARQALGEQTQTLTTMVSPGYAPFEQYMSKGDKQGPWTDIYGLGATLYRATIGRSPPNALDRSESILQAEHDIYVTTEEIAPAGFDMHFLKAIDQAMAFKADARPKSIQDWRVQFGNLLGVTNHVTNESLPTEVIDDATTVADTQITVTEKEVGKLKRIFKWLCIILILLILLAIIKGKKSNEAKTPDVIVETDTPVELIDDKETPAVQPTINETIDDQTQVIDSTSTKQIRGNPIPERQQKIIDRLQDKLNNGTDAEKRRAHAAAKKVAKLAEKQIKQAIEKGDFDLAEAYLLELQKIAPDNKELKNALSKVKEAKQKQSDN